jgi:hypothetical protein
MRYLIAVLPKLLSLFKKTGATALLHSLTKKEVKFCYKAEKGNTLAIT